MIQVSVVRRRRRTANGKGYRYSLRWRGPEGRSHYEAVGTDLTRARAERDAKEDRLNGRVPRQPTRVSWEQFTADERAATAGVLEPSTIEVEMRTLRAFGAFADHPDLLDVNVAMIEAFRAERLDRVSPATTNKDLRHLKAAFSRAVARGGLTENVLKRVRGIRLREPEPRVLTEAEETALLSACHEPILHGLVYTALRTGMRFGELLALEWADVDLQSGCVLVRAATTKNKKHRQVATDGEGLVILRGLNQDSQGQHPFRSDTVGRHHRQTVKQRFDRAVKASRINRCTFHDLRRTCLTRLAEAGVAPAALKAWAGHSSIATTMRHYVRLEAANVIEAVARARRTSDAALQTD